MLLQNNYNKLVEQLFLNIENKIDKYQEKNDIDYDIHQNIITITLSNNNKIIINKQESLYQIWLATNKNGYHFQYINNQWICIRTKKNFWEILKKSCKIQ
ncbi:MAG: iron donor protein CyaY [Buchnera aphidicola (Chaetogeoica yunlongensis)]